MADVKLHSVPNITVFFVVDEDTFVFVVHLYGAMWCC